MMWFPAFLLPSEISKIDSLVNNDEMIAKNPLIGTILKRNYAAAKLDYYMFNRLSKLFFQPQIYYDFTALRDGFRKLWSR